MYDRSSRLSWVVLSQLILLVSQAPLLYGQTEPVQLSSSPSHDESPAWNPAGETIIYATGPDPLFGIVQVQSNGAGETVLATGSGIGAGSGWVSPTQLYTWDRVSVHEILLFDVSSAPFERTVPNGSDAAFTSILTISSGIRPVFRVSRDGSTAIWQTPGPNGGRDIRTAPLSSLQGQEADEVGSVILNISGTFEDFHDMALMPDGSGFVVSESAGGSTEDLFYYSIDGTLIRRLTDFGPAALRRNNYPDISADGTTVVFSQDEVLPGSGGSEIEGRGILTVALSGETPPQLVSGTENQFAYSPSWSPDGTRIAYQRLDTELPEAPDNFNIYVTGVVGGLCPAGKGGVAPFQIEVNSTADLARSPTASTCDTGRKVKVDGTDVPECTLRAAIEEADILNALLSCGVNITFAPPSSLDAVIGDDDFVINVGNALPDVRSNTSIDGAAGASRAKLDGNGLKVSGLTVSGGEIAVRNLEIRQFDAYGLRITGASDVEVQGNRISTPDSGSPSLTGGIRIEGGATDITIGGISDEELNIVEGGIEIVDSGTERVRILRNNISVPVDWLDGFFPRVPIDIGGAGPSCDPPASGPNDGVLPPHVLELDPGSVRGMAEPGADVVAYRVVDAGSGRGQFWPRSVEAIGYAQAEPDGSFNINFDFEQTERTQITVSASSELSQLRRPVIYLHGVGGSWLEAADGTNLWVPSAVRDVAINDLLTRLGMHPDPLTDEGVASDEPIRATGILTSPVGDPVYRQIIERLRIAGFSDAVADQSSRSLWVHAYDWRRSPLQIARDLDDELDIVLTNGDIPSTCQVDIATHSNGGIVASVYVRLFANRSQKHLNRLITSGAPFLGAPRVAQAHLSGYLFGFAGVMPSFDPAWGRITETFRHLPDAYTLLPSRKYFEAADPNSRSHEDHYLVDPTGTPLLSYAATRAFMMSRKVDGGLELNVDILDREDQTVHTRIDDWTSWNGPPQIFRTVGDLEASTPTRYHPGDLLGDGNPQNIRRQRRAPMDTDDLARYRDRLLPDFGRGDGTVPLVSATLGRGVVSENGVEGAGRVDDSGVESPWIEEFDHFPCRHLQLVQDDCAGALDRTIQILESSYIVTGSLSKTQKSETALRAEALREIVYVSSSDPVDVRIENPVGTFTGPVSSDSLNKIVYGLPDVVYWSSGQVSAVSLSADSSYTLLVQALRDETVVRIGRVRVLPSGNESIFFEDVELEQKSIASIGFAPPATPATAAVDVDFDGDGSVDRVLEPTATAVSTSPGLATPSPQPFAIAAKALRGSGSSAVVSFELPDVGGPVWQWNLADSASWISPDATSGQSPASIHLTLDASSFGLGIYADTVWVALSLQDYTVTYPVTVELEVVDMLPSAGSVILNWDSPTGDGAAPPANLMATPTSGSQGKSYDTLTDIEEIEPNNSFSTAQEISGEPPLIVSGAIGQAGDMLDIFKVTTSAEGLTLNLDDLAADCDLNLLVETSGGAFFVIGSSRNEGETASEEVDMPELPAGDYFVQIRLVSVVQNANTTYRLTLAGDFVAAASTLQGYRVYRSIAPGAVAGGGQVAETGATATTYTDSDLPAGHYFYQVTALYDTGESRPSNEVEVVLPTPTIAKEPLLLPGETVLYQNYPNPFNPTTKISYDLPRLSEVRLTVHDVLGRQVQVLTSGTRPAGTYEVSFDATALPSGLYFYRLQAGDYVKTKRMVVVK